jgi:hypothetical protein
MPSPDAKHQRRRLTLEEYEREHLGAERENAKWIAFKETIEPEDEIWEYCSDEHSWDQLMGFGCVVLIRGGKTIATLTMRMN